MQIRQDVAAKRQLAKSLMVTKYLHEPVSVTPQHDAASAISTAFVRYGSAALMLLVVGTGGALTSENLSAAIRESRSFRVSELNHNGVIPGAVAPEVAAPSEELAFVREALKPSVTELAQFFGVSRQAIYNWQAGERLADHNLQLLTELANAARLLQEHGLAGSSSAIKRKLPGGKTMLEHLKSGEEGRHAAEILISMLAREATERARLSERLKGRDVPVSLGDMGASTGDKSV
ncbi:hypothetical protein TUM18999_61260 [Pseudomonas tohonis]|uniref:Uncharacterized protein n=1 Tax=Pseudomonas tohonis TaxID=2725477 RepID=A0A6J4EEF9_9PSED|nr:Cro/Cl family transcriptional regulator [Pseudomonas tohonis]BCG27935.1 hypothetical protein TUM18999_61260 [Pseudomonas tohonis]GJN52547.1 hypothetical protein TUM20286_22990 [Pseudomonas tohonis]